MPLAPGTRIGHYDIVALIGEGGMGQVYRARDTRLDRDVALKILPESFASNPDRRMRFEREAKTLASLNHPNIAHIHGLEDRALVMELVDGEDLSLKIKRGPIPLHEAQPIARQIAEALDAAHEAGVIHRDLKPANIRVRSDGTVKVLDFGLARWSPGSSDPGSKDPGLQEKQANSPTVTSPAMTALGVILGTAAYMSPEQAKGKTVDKRADIWAFGVVLYEMLTGRRAFKGDDASDLLVAVLSKDVELGALPAGTPSSVTTLIQRCLQRDPRNRLRDIGDARYALTATEIDETPRERPQTRAGGSRWLRTVPWLVAAALAVTVAVLLVKRFDPSPTAATPLRRFTVQVPASAAPNWGDFNVDISPDGTHIAYNCRDGNTVGICLRALDSLTATRIVNNRDTSIWCFSPDGESIAFSDGLALTKVSVRGGLPQLIRRWRDDDPLVSGFSWGPDGFILVGTASGIRRVAASGGELETVTQIAPNTDVIAHVFPKHLPDGRRALITLFHKEGRPTGGLLDIATGSVRDLGIPGQGFVYVPPGWLAFRQGDTLLGVAFDLANATPSKNPVRVIDNVRTLPRVARDGTLAYLPTRGESTARLVWVDRKGNPTPVATDRHDYAHLALARNGRHAALNLDAGRTFVLDLSNGTQKLVSGGSFPIWTADSDFVTIFARGALESVRADSSGKPQQLVSTARGNLFPTSWNSVTGELAYYDSNFQIWIKSTDSEPRPFLASERGRKRSARFSPDGKWMAFVSDEADDYQVYVTAYPGPGPTVRVSTTGGLSPIWSADSRELFFRLGTKVIAAQMISTQPLQFSVAKELFDGPYTLDLRGHQREDVAADGRFLMVQNSDDFPIQLVQNWGVELARVVR